MARAAFVTATVVAMLAFAAPAVADPLDGGWRAAVVAPGVTPPPVTATSPELGIFDPQVDLGHPEFAGAMVRTLSDAPVTERGSTEQASLAAAPVNGVGITGVWPGMRVVVAPPDDSSCTAAGRAVGDAVAAGASVVVTGYGWSGCEAVRVAVLAALDEDVLTVAPAAIQAKGASLGNEPGSLPHVLTAAPAAPAGAASFALPSPSTDLSAPGTGLRAAVPVALDDDGTPDGWHRVAGSAYSAAIAAAAATWIRAARPRLSAGQTAELLRRTAKDLGDPGYDELTGCGMVQIGPALTAPAPPEDPREPNDAVDQVDGSLFGEGAAPIWGGRRERVLDASLDAAEDPADVYPLRVAPGRRVVVRVRPLSGDPDLTVLLARPGRAPKRVGSSRTAGAERVAFRLGGRRKRTAYVQLTVASGAAAYALRVR